MPPYTYTVTPTKEESIYENLEGLEKPYQKNFKTLWGLTVMPVKWRNVILIVTIHCIPIYLTPFYDFGKQWRLSLYGAFLGILTGLGVTAGAHRYWCHRSFKANIPVQIFFIYCFALGGMLRIYDWVRDHRVHHKYSETDADPHNAKRGLFFSHVGWLFQKKLPEVIIKGKSVDMSDIENDPLIAFHDKYFSIIQPLCCFILPPLIPCYFWGETYFWAFWVSFFRWLCFLHCIWSVNSFAHMYGTRPYNSKIQPVENKYVSFWALGEGWHNYHHTFPWDYRAGEFGNKGPNATRRFLEKLAEYGWVYDLKYASEDLVRKTILSNGDGSHLICKEAEKLN